MKETRPLQTDSALFRYGFAVLMVAAATLLRIPLNPLLGVSAVPFILYFPVIMLSGWFGRLGPGVAATVLSALAALYFNIEPTFALMIPDWSAAFHLGLFFLEGIFISVIAEAWHRSRAALIQNKDLEAQQRIWLQVTLSSIGDAVMATDSSGRVSFMNAVAQSVTGWSQEEAAGQPIETVFNIVNEDTRRAVESPVTKVLREGTIVGLANHTVLIRKDGAEVPIDDSGAPIKDGDGNVIGVVLVFRDITERRRADEAVRRWEQVFEQASWGVVIANPVDNTLQAVNQSYADMHGYTVEEMVGMPLALTLAPDARGQWPERVRVTNERGHNVYESLHVRKDGTQFHVLMDITAVKDKNGKILYRAATLQDITERKRAEEAVRKSEERFTRAFNAVPIPISITGVGDERIVAANEAFVRTSGYAREEVIGRTGAELNLWEDPADRDRLAGLLRQHKKIRDLEIRFRSRSGRLSTYLMSAEVIEFSGEPCILSAVNDITERKIAEERLAFAASIVESSDDAIIGKTLDGEIISWNAGAQRMYGYIADEVISKHIAVLAPNERRAEIERILETLRRGERVYHYETMRMTKDGRRLDVSLSISPIRNPDGEIIGAATIARDITERKRAEAEHAKLLSEIENQRQRLNNVVANVPGVVWEAWGEPDAARQRIDFVSDYVEKMLGYGVQEWLSVPNFWLSIVHPEDKERAAREASAIYASRKGGRSEFRWVSKDGRTLWVDAQSVVVCDEAGNPVGMRGVTMDISERKRAEEAQEFLAEASSVLASSLDYETTLASVAQLTVPRLADWCGVEIVEEDGRSRQLAVAHADPEKVKFALELSRRYPADPGSPVGVPNVLRTGKAEFYPEITEETLVAGTRDEEHLRLIGELGMRSAMIVPLVARGRTHGAITLVTAESEHRYDKADLALAEDLARRAAFAVDNARLYREARRARAEAEEANRAKDEFLATVSHELRTPLNAIIGWAHMLRHNKFDEPTTGRAMETIERNARSQARLIEDILDVSRIITGKLRMDVQPIELIPVIEASVDAVRPAAAAKEVRLQTILDPQAGPVSGDASRLQQVVWNLMSNAVKFTPRGGRIQVRLERVDSHIEIIVSDTGQGIAADLLPYIFERFRQGDSSSTRLHGGLGLGLAIVRHLVELHGGTVQAWSPGEGQGATFTVKLPLLIWHRGVKQAESAHLAAYGGGALENAPRLDGLRVLVVDDEPDTRAMLKVMLEQFGAEAEVCASSAEALDRLEQWRPNVLVSDIEMPGEDGYQMIKKIRALEPGRGGAIAAVALTAYARAEDRVRSLAAGYQMHLAKPVEPVELAIVIGNLAGRGGKGRAG
ncbi:MAG: PAS domain S-box protein [Blastocatellia bacterium]